MGEGGLKPGWTRVAFGDVVRQVKEKLDPQRSGLERYIGGEHMDTDDLRLRRWGTIGENYLGPAFHMRFSPGQVLYGSRRTYLRKVAHADFPGICANTTYVLESRDPSVLLPDLLPFLMQTEAFHQHSKEQSKGSVNPYVNFSDLAWFEFALPPLREQERIVELLQAVKEMREGLRELNQANYRFARAWASSTVAKWQRAGPVVQLGVVLLGSPESGSSAPPVTIETGRYVLSLSALGPAGYVSGALKRVPASAAMDKALLAKGDMLISRSNTRERVGFIGIYDGLGEGTVSFPDTMMRLRPNPKVIRPIFLEWLVQSPPVRNAIQATAAGTSASMKKINRGGLLSVPIPELSLIEQDAVLNKIQVLKQSIHRIQQRRHQAAVLIRGCQMLIV